MANPLSRSAIQAMDAKLWRKAEVLWQARMESHAACSAADYNGFARTLECLGKWAAYKNIISLGLNTFPDDCGLRRRQQHAKAVCCMLSGQWQEASDLLNHLRADSLQFDWPCAINYWSRQARYEMALADIEKKQARLVVLAEMSLFKASDLMPQRAAGLFLVAGCLNWPASFQLEFCQRVQPLVDCLRCHDLPIRLIEDAALSTAVAALAAFWSGNDGYLSLLPAGVCEFFSRLFLCFGYLDLYILLRERFVALLSALDSQCASEAQFAYEVSLSNEMADEQRFTELQGFSPEREDIQAYMNISALYYAGHEHTCSAEIEEGDFESYIEGRSIAVVGPVDVGLDNGAEIDSFDRVVRFNYRGIAGYDSVRFGCRTDISYYANSPTLLDLSPDFLSSLAELDFAMFLKRAWRECSWLEQVKCRVRERPDHWTYLRNPMLMGYPTAIPRMLFDLLRFKPARVKVFCSNLYTGMAYQAEYLKYSSLGRNGGNVFPGFSMHDPISNYVLMQRLVRAGRIEVDSVLDEVINLTERDYLDRLRTAHANFVVLPRQGGVL